MLLGVLLHAVVIYLEPEDGSDPAVWVGVLFIWIHNWRMPLFFMLAGFFAALSLDRKKASSFSWDRIYRIGFPIILWFPPDFLYGLPFALICIIGFPPTDHHLTVKQIVVNAPQKGCG